ncbi:MAG: nucleoside-triphosphatase [Anaerolineae bacterium]|nr:nucleoside-triphosphatase [Anaerolineae bacterium]
MSSDPRIMLVTGERQVGKTTALKRALTTIRQAGVSVSGLLTQRTGPHDLEVWELVTESVYRLTDPFDASSASPLVHFNMNAAAMARSARALAGSFPTQVFVLDEMGPLELRHRQGWVDVLTLLAREAYVFAVVVVRPSLVGQAVVELPVTMYSVVHVTPHNREGVPALIANEAITACGRVAAGERETDL